MTLTTTLRPSVVQYLSGPTISNTKDSRDFIRKTGGFFPEQQTFLGASIKSFSISNGKGSTPSSLTVELVEDPHGTNPTIDDVNKANGVYDPYHHNKVGDSFSPPGIGMPVFFVYSNPRVTIKQAYDPSYFPKSYESVLKFGGLLQSFHQTNSIGGKTYSVTVVDPREILSNIYLILNHADDKVGLRENNIFNVFGFLEYNPTKDTRLKFKSYQNNTFRRSADGTSVGGDDMYYKTVPIKNINDLNFTQYFENAGWDKQFPITGTGMSRRSSYGIPYYRIMQALSAMSSSLPDQEYSGFSGNILYRGLNYKIYFNNLPPLHPMYFFDYDNIDLLSFLVEVGESCGYEINVSLEPHFQSVTPDLKDIVGGNIVVSFINRSNESSVGQIRNFINNKENFPNFTYKMSNGNVVKESIIEKEDIGYEMTNPTTSKVIFGGNRVDLHAFTSNHDNGRYILGGQAGGSSSSDQIIPYYGILKDNVVVPTRGAGEWTQILLDSSGLGAFGVGNYYVATEAELRYALKGFKSWKNFMEFYNSKWLQEINTAGKFKYIDVLINGAQPIKIDGKEYGLKVPRCLFANDEGTTIIEGEGFFKNPCCPAFGYPLYYNRAVAIGLTMKKVIDDRYSVVADLRILKANGDDPVILQKVINGLLNKYKSLSRIRRLTRAELDAVKLFESQRPGLDAEYIEDVISKINGQILVPAKNQTTRAENCQKVFSFIKNVAEECYGKKWLVRIPNKPNFKFDSKTTKGVDLSENKYVYTRGYFGFKPITNKSSASLVKACPDEQSFVYNSNDNRTDIAVEKAQSLFKPALVSNYNPIDDSLVYNYTPNDAGGFVDYSMYQQALRTAFIPKDLNSFGSDHRIKAYVRYDHAEKLNLTSDGSKVYTEYVGDNTDRINSIPRKTESYDRFNANTTSGTLIAFIPASLDTRFYHKQITINRNVEVCGGRTIKSHPITSPVTPDASGNIPPDAGSITKFITEIMPTTFSTGSQNISDFPRDKYGKIQIYPDMSETYALITIPSLVGLKYEKLSDMPKRDSYKVATYPGQFNDQLQIGTVEKIEIKKRIDFENFGGAATFYNPDRLFSSPIAIKPDIVVIPLENQQQCYGPWYNGPIRYKDENNQYRWKTLKNLGGKVEIQNDASLCPWNFGSYELMNIAGESKVQLANTLYLASEKGSVSYPGLPMGKQEIGNLISQGGPILDSISIDVSTEGVRTSYRFQTYSRSFANIQKQQEHKINMIKNASLKYSKDSFELLHKGLIKNKFKGIAPPARESKPYQSVINPLYVNPVPYNTMMSSIYSVTNPSTPRKFSDSTASSQSSVSSSESTQEFYNQDDDVFSQGRDYYNSAQQDMSDTQIAASKQYHHLMPSMDNIEQEQIEDLYANFSDPYNIDKIYLTYWG